MLEGHSSYFLHVTLCLFHVWIMYMWWTSMNSPSHCCHSTYPITLSHIFAKQECEEKKRFITYYVAVPPSWYSECIFLSSGSLISISVSHPFSGILQVLEHMDALGICHSAMHEYDCLLLSLPYLFHCVPAHSILQSVSIIHRCSQTWTVCVCF